MDSTTRASTIAASNGGSWDIGDPEELLRRLHRQHPNADRAELRGIFLDHLSAMVAHEIIRPLGAVFFDARYTYIVRPAPLAIVSSPTLREKARQEVGGAMRNLMALMMPNGKRLGDCTRTDLIRLGAQCTRIAKHIPRGKLVRDVLDEGALQRLWNRRA